MINFDDQQKFEAVKYRHEDQSNLLQVMSGIDLKIIISFFTLQLLLGGFLAKIILSFYVKFGFILIDSIISFICILLLLNNYKRRKEVVGTIKNCNTFLRYNEIGYYIKDDELNSTTKFRPWFGWYVLSIIFALFGMVIITFFNPNCTESQSNPDKKDREQDINLSCLSYNNKG